MIFIWQAVEEEKVRDSGACELNSRWAFHSEELQNLMKSVRAFFYWLWWPLEGALVQAPRAAGVQSLP